MSTRRVQKVAEAIREVVSMTILTELQDPRVRDVTVIGVEVSGDLHYAKVLVSVMGDETRQNLSLRGLQNSAGFIQAKIAERLDLRYTPKLTFVLDLGVKKSMAIAQILREVLPGERADVSVAVPADSPSDEQGDEAAGWNTTSESTARELPLPVATPAGPPHAPAPHSQL